MKVRGQHQPRSHARSALEPAWRRARRANRRIIRRAADSSEIEVLKATEIAIAAGDRVTFLTAGGGYGDPRERAAEAARHIAASLVSSNAEPQRISS